MTKHREITDEELELIEMRYRQALALTNLEDLFAEGQLDCTRGPSSMTSFTHPYAAPTQTACQRLPRPALPADCLQIPDTPRAARPIAGPPRETGPETAYPARSPQHTRRC